MLRPIAALLLSFSLSSVLCAQSPPATLVPPAPQSSTAATPPPAQKPFRLVRPIGLGLVTISPDPLWRPIRFALIQNSSPSVLFIDRERPKLSVSYTMFAAPSNAATSEDCRESVLQPLVKHLATNIDPATLKRAEKQTETGPTLATVTFTTYGTPELTANPATRKIRGDHTYTFIASDGLCAEIQVSNLSADEKTPDAVPALPEFHFTPAFAPRTDEYASLATILYRATRDYPSAAVYYSDALSSLPRTIPETAALRNVRRFLTDQLAMSYGLSGDIKRSREVNLAAIARDPDYPLYYYNLACADAEEGKPDAARIHLEQAFARKANTIPGETLPDPRKDDSILKLKKNKALWAFVESLPAN